MKFGIIIICSLLLFSCGGTETVSLSNREAVVDMIIDLQTIKEVVNIYPHEQKDSINGVLMEKFYKLHNIDSLSLVNIFIDMRRNPELLKELHEESLEKVNSLILPQ